MNEHSARNLRRRDVLRGMAAVGGMAAAGGFGGSLLAAGTASAATAGNLQALQQKFVDMRFGMFIHYNMGTYHDAEWVSPGQDPSSFNPTKLDCGQWAAAAKSAKMTFGILTTKHHDGFCLWPTKQTRYNVMNSSYQQDVVRKYVDAFRAAGLEPWMYFSVWDRNQGIASGSVSRADIDFVKAQLTELLGGTYGTIPVLVFDGWAWQAGHRQIPYGEIREHIKAMQPNILIVDINGHSEPWEQDILFYEEPLSVTAPSDNTYASCQGQTITGGWFWHPSTPTATPLSLASIVDRHLKVLEPVHCTFILNCPPNPDGLLDTNIVNRLAEVGAAWTPDTSRPALPAQKDVLLHAVTPTAVTATSGTATNAVDGLIDYPKSSKSQSLWETTGSLPQSVTLDLGATFTHLDTLEYLPREDKDSSGAYVTTGNITSYEIHTSTDGSSFTRATSGTWAGDKTVKQARFGAVSARYVRLVAVNTVGGSIAVASEVNCGGIAAKPASSLTSPVQTPVLPGSDNSLSLTPALAALDNGGMKLENSPANIGYWSSSSDNATWRVRFDAPGTYTVTATVAATAASRLVLDAGIGSAAIVVPSTGSWSTYTTVTTTMTVPESGYRTVSLRPDKSITWQSVNVRGITLTPGADGSLSLTAATATLSGSAIKLENDPPDIGYWTSASATASWTVTFPAAGTYSVRARVSAGYGATAFTLDTGAGSTTLPVARTSGWDDYVTVEGTTTVSAAGRRTVVIKPANASTWQAMNLQWADLKLSH
ncbi:alpha-L-fucosidase [Streptomyces sp. NBC_01518]|uniref:alpha-L-fucosidase n=1 Tax=Streptomyces sp. NBC_01518 TaxID=2903891 RepID=UPI003866662D